MISPPILNFPAYSFKTRLDNGKPLIFDGIRKKYVALTPEEWVRQHLIRFLIDEKHYPAGLIAVETPLRFAQMDKRSDVVVYDRNARPLLLAECKAPEVEITQKVFEQIAVYQQSVQSAYLLVTNGLQHYCLSVATSQWLAEIPDYQLYLQIDVK